MTSNKQEVQFEKENYEKFHTAVRNFSKLLRQGLPKELVSYLEDPRSFKIVQRVWKETERVAQRQAKIVITFSTSLKIGEIITSKVVNTGANICTNATIIAMEK